MKAGVKKWCGVVLILLYWPFIAAAQNVTEKQVLQQYQVWASINNTIRFSEHWGILADFHIRTNNFLSDQNFYFVRGAANYWFRDNITAAAGYAHMWLAPTRVDWHVFSNENRIYQQFQVSTKKDRIFILHRLRNEQRWQQKIVNDNKTDNYKFTDRVRYLFSFNCAVSRNKYVPSLVISDEILIQFGKEVVYNTFDQNRLFIGIKQNINPRLNFDFGYMNVYQQRATGYNYDMNHTLRLFFYYNTRWKRENKHNLNQSGEE